MSGWNCSPPPVIWLNDHIGQLDIQAALLKVSRQRAEYSMRYIHDRDRRLSLAVYLLLQEALRKEYGIMDTPEFVFGPHGKPMLKGYPWIHFNLSHCPEAALCVVDGSPLGCDVESVPEELDMEVCQHCFNDEEIAGILASDNPRQSFARLWTMKEAFLKYTGEGISERLPKLLTTPEASRVSFRTRIGRDGTYVYTICQATDRR